MSVEEAILEKVRALPPEKQDEVLKFADSLGAPQECEKRPVSIDEEIAKMAAELPEEQRPEFLKWAAYLKEGHETRTPLKSLEGLWADSGVSISDEDIAGARREMWGRFGDEPGK
jgi:hypothetical protein